MEDKSGSWETRVEAPTVVQARDDRYVTRVQAKERVRNGWIPGRF